MRRPGTRTLSIVLAWVAAFGLQCSSGGGSDAVSTGPMCDALCDAAARCDEPPESEDACAALCDGQRATYNQTAWSTYASCVESSACESPSACMQEAVAVTSEAPVEQFLQEICAWAVGCAGGLLTQAMCVEMFRGIGDDDSDAGADESSPWDVVRLLRGDLVRCISGCVRGLSCGETDFGGAGLMCAETCGVAGLGVFGDPPEPDPTCEDEHGNCGANGSIRENEFGGCECVCDDGYVSSEWVCVPGCAMTGCGGHGECDESGTCNCDEGYFAIPGEESGGCAPSPYYLDLAVAEDSGCAVRSDTGGVECWGDTSDAAQEVPEDNQGFVQVEMGSHPVDSSACALRENGEYACWGQIAQPDARLAPRFLSLSLTRDIACGVLPDRTLYCWGFDPSGVTSPDGEADYESVAIGDRIGCGIHTGGTLSCWGDDAVVSQMPAGIDDAEQVCAAAGGACVRRAGGSIECFGFASYASMEIPAPNSGFTDVTCGGYHACALRADGTPACWGIDALVGQLEPPDERRDGYTDLEASDDHTCGLRDGGVVSCWGREFYNEAPEERRASREKMMAAAARTER